MIQEYLRHWWIGDAAQHYHCFRLTIGQLNKLAKIGQYFTGVLALFDLVAFSKVMGHLRFASYVAIRSQRLWHYIFDLPSLLLRLMLAIGSALLRRLPWSAVPRVLRSHFVNAIDESAEDADSFFLVQALKWLEQHPVPDKTIKATNFCLFLLFSGIELLTS